MAPRLPMLPTIPFNYLLYICTFSHLYPDQHHLACRSRLPVSLGLSCRDLSLSMSFVQLWLVPLCLSVSLSPSLSVTSFSSFYVCLWSSGVCDGSLCLWLVSLPVSLSVCLWPVSPCLCFSLYLAVCLSVCISVSDCVLYLCVCLWLVSVFLFVPCCPSLTCPSLCDVSVTCLPVCLSCLSVCVHLSVCDLSEPWVVVDVVHGSIKLLPDPSLSNIRLGSVRQPSPISESAFIKDLKRVVRACGKRGLGV